MHGQVVCPCCQGVARLMPVLSDISSTDYYRCDTCGAVSLTPKHGPGPAIPFKITATDDDVRAARNARF